MHDLASPPTAPQSASAAPSSTTHWLAILSRGGKPEFHAYHGYYDGRDEFTLRFKDDTCINLGILDGNAIGISVSMPMDDGGEIARYTDFDRGLYIDPEGRLEVDSSGLFHAMCKEPSGTKAFCWGISLQLSPELAPLVNYCIGIARQQAKGLPIDSWPQLIFRSDVVVMTLDEPKLTASIQRRFIEAGDSQGSKPDGFLVRTPQGSCMTVSDQIHEGHESMAEAILAHVGPEFAPALPFAIGMLPHLSGAAK